MEYRAYFLGSSGSLVRAKVLEAANDASAIGQARDLVDGHDVELWQLARKVTVLKRQEPAP